MYNEKEIHEASCDIEQREITKQLYKRVGANVHPVAVERVEALLEGAIDVHIHGGPDAYGQRIGDEIEIAIQACEARMGAVVFKCASSPNARSIPFVQKVVDQWAVQNGRKKTSIFGGVVLNNAMGGINPEAVRVNGKFGGKYVWMPTLDASHHHRTIGTTGGIDIVGENGELLPPVFEVLKAIAEFDMVLGICHQSTKERFMLVDEAKKVGVKRIEICHPLLSITRMTLDQMRVVCEKGAYLGLYCLNLTPPKFFMEEFLQVINLLGPDSIVLGTDLGFWRSPPPVATFKCYIAELLEQGVPDKVVEKMAKTNAMKLLY